MTGYETDKKDFSALQDNPSELTSSESSKPDDFNIRDEFNKLKKSFKELESESKIKYKETDNLLRVGFYFLLVMVATIIISLEMWFISGNNSNLEKIYDFENININTSSNQQIQLDSLNNQMKLLKGCLKNGGWNSCLQ